MVNKHLIKFILLFFVPLCSAAAATITHIQTVNFANYTRVILSLDEQGEFKVFTLGNPERTVVDLYEGHLTPGVKNIDLSKSTIENIRSGRPVPDTLRLVFDMKGAVRVKSFMAPDNNSHEAQLVIDLYPKQQTVTEVSAPAPEKVVVKTTTVTQAKHKKTSTTRVSAKVKILSVPRLHRVVVVIDPGHGGKDPGTVGPDGTMEKDVVLALGLKLAELINTEPNMRAVLTRKTDEFVTLRDRLAESRKNGADIFIALHADSYLRDNSTGASVYALSHHGASSMAARWLADKENHSELGGVDLNELGDKSVILRSVLIDLAQTATITDSILLGTDVLQSLQNVTTLHYPRVEQAPFMVLKSPDIPSILVETGFLSNPIEEEHLRDPYYRDKLARSLLSGIQRYIVSHPGMATSSKTQEVG